MASRRSFPSCQRRMTVVIVATSTVASRAVTPARLEKETVETRRTVSPPIRIPTAEEDNLDAHLQEAPVHRDRRSDADRCPGAMVPFRAVIIFPRLLTFSYSESHHHGGGNAGRPGNSRRGNCAGRSAAAERRLCGACDRLYAKSPGIG